MLSREVQSKYRQNCNITDSNKKMTDLMINFQIFEMQMKSDLDLSRTSMSLFH